MTLAKRGALLFVTVLPVSQLTLAAAVDSKPATTTSFESFAGRIAQLTVGITALIEHFISFFVAQLRRLLRPLLCQPWMSGIDGSSVGIEACHP